MWHTLEIINLIDKGINALKDKAIRNAIEAFGNAMAQSGKDLEDEIYWVGERALELTLNIRTSLLSAVWFYFSLHLGTKGNEQLNYLSQAQGLLSYDSLILKPVAARVFKRFQEKGKIPSRNLAIQMIALDNGMKELEKLIKNSLKKFISIPENEEKNSQNKQDESINENDS